MKLIATLIIAITGACLYRWRGWGNKYKKYFPRPFNQLAFALPLAIYTYFHTTTFILDQIVVHQWLQALIVWALTTLAIVTGHGRWMDLAHAQSEGKPERMEFLIQWLKPYMKPYWYDFLGLMVNGLLITLPAGLFTLNPLLAISGVLKAPAYAIGWQVYPDHRGKDGAFLGEATAVGEFFTGFFIWGSLGYLWLYT